MLPWEGRNQWMMFHKPGDMHLDRTDPRYTETIRLPDTVNILLRF